MFKTVLSPFNLASQASQGLQGIDASVRNIVCRKRASLLPDQIVLYFYNHVQRNVVAFPLLVGTARLVPSAEKSRAATGWLREDMNSSILIGGTASVDRRSFLPSRNQQRRKIKHGDIISTSGSCCWFRERCDSSDVVTIESVGWEYGGTKSVFQF
jgi:hypothetical protein